MSNMNVALTVTFKNLVSKGVQDAKKDIVGLKNETNGLKSIQGPPREVLRPLTKGAQDASAAVRQLKKDVAGLGALKVPNIGNAAIMGVKNTALGLGSGLTQGMVGAGASAGLVGVALAASRASAENERALTRIAITGDASRAEQEAAGRAIEALADKTTASTLKIRDGLDSLVAAGRSVPDAMAFLPSVVTTATASGSEITDIAKSADAMAGSLKISAAEMQRAFDVMVTGGKLGKFETKDMARYFPELAPMAKEAGMTGVDGLTRLVTYLQMIRKETGTSEEAATNLKNVFSKIFSAETEKKFEKMGIDLPAVMKKAKIEGKDLLETFVAITLEATKGDMTKLPKLFEDMQVQSGMRALLNQLQATKRMMAEIGASAEGAVGRDLRRVLQDQQSAWDRLSNAASRFFRNLGPSLDAPLEVISSGLNKINTALEKTATAKSALDAAGVKPLAALKTQAEYEADLVLQKTAPVAPGGMKDGGFHNVKPKAVSGANNAYSAADHAREADDIARETGDYGAGMAEAKGSIAQQRAGGATFATLEKNNKILEARLSAVLAVIAKGRLPAEEERVQRHRAAGYLQTIMNNERRMNGGAVEASQPEITKELVRRLDEIKAKSAETSAAIKQDMSINLSSEGQNAAQSFADGFIAGSPPAIGAARNLAEEIRRGMGSPAGSRSPASGGGERRPTGGSASLGGGGNTTVQVAAIHITGVSDPEAAGKAAVRQLSQAINQRLAGAHHDGVVA